jgi:hypothetical protein
MFIPFGESLVNADRVDYFEFVVMCESKTGGGAVKIASLLASQAPELIQGSPDQVSKNLSRLFAGKLDGAYGKALFGVPSLSPQAKLSVPKALTKCARCLGVSDGKCVREAPSSCLRSGC